MKRRDAIIKAWEIECKEMGIGKLSQEVANDTLDVFFSSRRQLYMNLYDLYKYPFETLFPILCALTRVKLRQNEIRRLDSIITKMAERLRKWNLSLPQVKEEEFAREIEGLHKKRKSCCIVLFDADRMTDESKSKSPLELHDIYLIPPKGKKRKIKCIQANPEKETFCQTIWDRKLYKLSAFLRMAVDELRKERVIDSPGDEFTLILYGTTIEDAEKFSRQVIEEVKKTSHLSLSAAILEIAPRKESLDAEQVHRTLSVLLETAKPEGQETGEEQGLIISAKLSA